MSAIFAPAGFRSERIFFMPLIIVGPFHAVKMAATASASSFNIFSVPPTALEILSRLDSIRPSTFSTAPKPFSMTLATVSVILNFSFMSVIFLPNRLLIIVSASLTLAAVSSYFLLMESAAFV